MRSIVSFIIFVSLSFGITQSSATASAEVEELYQATCAVENEGCLPPYLTCDQTNDGLQCVRKGLFPITSTCYKN